ncbi:hypothetical protein C7H84_33910 [Burkholderia sp. Nafp2/4-1b]|uniref:hypothetical protein n=1 Tax=Burkholderia sp. Nafp2/4-1b TaxID=2116686 RepID=UPI000EF85E0B|nr:hypothetical protein [Burkholderia sp. Nafp2/4-1b]RKT98988.1 hypothetical protein C7H84_33910 [Burkholderia sp. Nafp2/4-1b]
MLRFEILFQLGYSIRLERMHEILLARMDRFISFTQIFLGITIVVGILPITGGIIVAALSAFSFAYQPGVKSVRACMQKRKYESLLAEASSVDNDTLLERYCALQENGSQIIRVLMHPAHVGEEIRLGREPTLDLTFIERMSAFIAGDLPRRTKPYA